MRIGGDRFEERGWWADIVDKARSGIAFRKFKVGRAAGHRLCVSPAIGTFAELNARADIKAVNGAMGVVTDIGTWGSNWVVQGGEWMPDGPIQGNGAPEGVVAAPVGSVYEQRDADDSHRVWNKAEGSGNTGWIPAILDPAAAPISDAVAAALAELDSLARMPGSAMTYAMELLTAEEQADVRTPNLPTIPVHAKIQAWMDAAYLLYGSAVNRKGGQGCRVLFHAGSWLMDGLVLKAGMALVGLASRYEVRFLQTSTARQPLLDILGRGQNTQDTQRRTDVFLQDLFLKANKLTDANGDPIHCCWLRPEEDLDQNDNIANRTGVIAHRVQFTNASGWGFYSKKRGRNWLHECQATQNGIATGGTKDCGGFFIQGPDCLLVKCYGGENAGPQIHVFSSATPMIDHVECGPGQQPHIYPAVLMEECTDFVLHNGNCNGWIQVKGGDGDNTNYDYGVHIRGVISNVIFNLQDKSFLDPDDVFHDIDGYINIKLSRGVHIAGCRFKPVENRIVDAVTGAVSYQFLYRPKRIVWVEGPNSCCSFDCALPTLADPLWPAGEPTQWPGAMPVNTWDSITNKPDRVPLWFIDPTNGVHAWVANRLKFMPGGGILGLTDGTAVAAGYIGELMTTEIDNSAPVSLAATGSVYSIASLTLTPGNWEVRGSVVLQGAGATATAIEIGTAANGSSISPVSAKRYAGQALNVSGVTGPLGTLKVGPYELRVTANTTRHLNAKAAFSAGTVAAYGVLEARRLS